MEAVVGHRRAPNLSVGDEDLDVVGGGEFGDEQVDGLDRAPVAAGLDVLPDLERAEQQKHDPRRQIAQRSLQREADGEAGGTEDRDQARRLYAELGEHGQDDENQDDVADQARQEMAEGNVNFFDFAQAAVDRSPRPAGDDPTDDQDDHTADHAQPVGGDEGGDLLASALDPRHDLIHLFHLSLLEISLLARHHPHREASGRGVLPHICAYVYFFQPRVRDRQSFNFHSLTDPKKSGHRLAVKYFGRRRRYETTIVNLL